MKQFPIDLSDSLRNGLRPYKQLQKGAPFLTKCLNAKPREYGLVQQENVTNHITLPLQMAFPEPQYFRGRKYSLLAYDDAVYTINDTTGVATVIGLTDYDDYVSGINIVSSGGPWHFIDLDYAWILMNNNNVVFRLPRGSYTSGGSDVVVANNSNTAGFETQIRTGAHHRGRTVLGGFDPDKFWSTDWATLWTDLQNKIPPELSNTMNVDDNWVMCSNIGGGAFDLLWLLYPAIADTGLISGASETDLFMQYVERNDWWMGPMPWKGEVQHIKALGDNVVIYGEGGVTALRLVTDPISTYAVVPLSDIGIASRSAVAGDDDEHHYIDQKGDLNVITSDLQRKNLGYREFFSPLLSSEIIGSWDSAERESYFCTSRCGYVFTGKGLGELSVFPTTLVDIEGTLTGVYKETAHNRMQIRTQPFDMREPGIKMLDSMEVHGTFKGSLTSKTLYKYEQGEEFATSEQKEFNPVGIAHPQVSGIEFMAEIEAMPNSDVVMSDLIGHFKLTDRRARRGLSVNKTSS